MLYKYTYSTIIGPLTVCCDESGITNINLGSDLVEFKEFEEIETTLIKKAYLQLDEYFKGQRISFDLPLSLHGTPFQVSVWKALMSVGYGETCSYKQIATLVGCPKGARAVGMANHHNPIMIVIPCHRCIGANGSLVGYGGGLDVKIRLLELEQAYK